MAGGDREASKLEEELCEDAGEPFYKTMLGELKEYLVRLYFQMMLYFYYREVDVVGQHNVPTDGPVIFMGNHQNQFVDGVMLFAHCPRTPHFIIAAKSMKRAVVGDVARFMNCIPVRRPQDEAVAGEGFIEKLSLNGLKGTATGMHTKFTAIAEGSLISLAGGKATFKFVSAKSDTEAVISFHDDPGDMTLSEPIAFKVQPRINQKDMWKSVFDKLQDNKCLGIFPEGGSHDQTTMLDMKDGVARFAFGALENGNSRAPVIVPVGLTYYHGHRFRSRAHMEFGKPVRIDSDWYRRYQADKSETIKEFMGELKTAMENVTIQCSDWTRLKQVHFVRRLYLPPTMTLDAQEYLRVTRKLARVVDMPQDEESQQYLRRLDDYMKLLKGYLLTDHQVVSLALLQKRTSYKLLFDRVFTTSFWFVVALPGIAVNLPVGILARIYSEIKTKEAVAASSVKLKGNDVKASFKTICCMALGPVWLSLIATLCWIYLGFGNAVLTWVLYPIWTYYSVVWANKCIVSARSTFPMLLALHSPKYAARFQDLYQLRTKLVAETRYLLHAKYRGGPVWSESAEKLYRHIRATEAEDLEGQQHLTPFTLEHQSRTVTPRGVVLH
eukprot:TRINITY_DN1102_c0_g4_i1.p1 TRINITY_DN1102_c0_g4~~TRINITY_DN1102_c0_g4_i1.p1  ORF type:complete len:610 (+),score=238.72 TRINITY_DN1102_c0_g4_i1:69-1898(+)